MTRWRLASSAVVVVLLAAHATSIQSRSYYNPFRKYTDGPAYSSVSFTHNQQIYHPSPNDQPSYHGPRIHGSGHGGPPGFGYSQTHLPPQEHQSRYSRPLPSQPLYHSPDPLIAGPAPARGYSLPRPGSPYSENSLVGGPFYGIAAPPAEQGCPIKSYGPCSKSKFRTIDGSCNNLRNPTQGTPNTKYNRLLPARYADGIHLPPVSVTGNKLPGARLVSIVLFPDKPIPDPVWTLSSMQWGQIITHDMSMAMGTTQTKPYANQCCSPDGRLQIPHDRAPAQCYPIEIPGDDPLYSKFGQMCMNFMRSTTDVDRGCAPPHAQAHEQMVTVTHYLDASLVYGSDLQTAAALREGNGGRLKVDVRGGRQWPPPAANKSATCANQDDDEPCYRFGDVRANQNPQLTVLQIILLREHNRLADTLRHINPHWDDERLYQEARRILIAEYQHINYAEWLPIFIGTKNMMKYGLLYKTDGYVNDYREDVDPSVINGHATAAFRYFHSAIQGQIHLISEKRSSYGALRLSDYLNKPGVIEDGDNMDSLTRGLATQNQEEVDPFLTSEITDYLFRNGMPFGRDLRAIDIQRGRDHGLSSYNDYRQFCGLPRAHNFQDFGDYISPENIEKIALLYDSPDDVDLVVGGSLEKHIKDTLTGPTFLCIMLEQFYRTRVADRYFYESGDPHVAFTPEQLREIRKATVSRLFCDNGDQIQYMQPEGFRVIGEKNQLVPCENIDAIPAIDLGWWKEEPTHYSGHLGRDLPRFDDFDLYSKK